MTQVIKYIKGFAIIEKFYIWLMTVVSGFLAYYTDLHLALAFFFCATTLDTASAIDVAARAKGLKFNPFKKYFWKEISSTGLRTWCEKVFWQYGRYLFIAFILNEWVLKNMIIFDYFNRKLTLPVVAVYLFGFIELWSIGENIEKSGGINIFKRLLQFLPENVQQIFKPNADSLPVLDAELVDGQDPNELK
jgi:hypothetical protein